MLRRRVNSPSPDSSPLFTPDDLEDISLPWCWMEPSDTLQHLPEYLPGHSHLAKLKHQPPGMPHQTSTHLDELGLHTSQ